MAGLSEANRRALDQARARAERDRERHLARIAGLGVDPAPLLAAVPGAGALTLNFHPGRRLADRRTVAEALHDEGVYRSQFETRVSGGGLTAYPGGDRDRWERSLFAGAYHATGVRDDERPRYGGLNLMRHRNGACPGFGSCHLRLRRAAERRATLIYGDSNAEPTDIGLIDAFAPVLAPLLEDVAASGNALGHQGMTVQAFADGLLGGGFAPAMSHDLLHYVEAQVHGAIDLERDVEAVVLDPALDGTSAGERLLAAAERHGFAAERHDGVALALEAIPEEVPERTGGEPFEWQKLCADGRARRLAEEVTGGAPLDAANLGRATAAGTHDPQHLKYLWRMVVAYGS